MIKAVLIDLSGTLHVDDIALTGAVQALKRLRTTGLLLRFVTNTTKESQRILYERLIKLGFELQSNEIFSSLAAAQYLIESRKLRPMLLLSDDAMEDFEDFQPKPIERINAVVIGLAPNCFHYEKLNEAFRCLQNGAKLIAIHEAKYYKRSDGLALGPGCFVKGLEYAAQCKAELVGKPNKAFFKAALGMIQPEHAIMIGDDVTDDIKGAIDAGLQGYLVQTGKYQAGDEKKIDPPPTLVCKSFVEAVDVIMEKMK